MSELHKQSKLLLSGFPQHPLLKLIFETIELIPIDYLSSKEIWALGANQWDRQLYDSDFFRLIDKIMLRYSVARMQVRCASSAPKLKYLIDNKWVESTTDQYIEVLIKLSNIF